MKHLTIKARIMLLCVLLTFAVSALALGVMLHNEHRVAEGYFRNSLASTAQLARDELRIENGRLEIDRNLDDLPNVRVALYTADGDLIYGQQRFELPFLEGEMRQAESASGIRWAVQDTRMTLEDGRWLWLRCYMSSEAVSSMQGSRREVLLILFPALILLAGLGGWLIARRAFRPITQIIRTAEGIADGADLKKRIALTGAHDEIYRTAQGFDAMLDRLEAAFERERRFTSDASHELRTPVTAIMTQSEFALSDAADEEDRIEALREIHARSRNMARLIQSLLTLSRLDAKQQLDEVEAVDLCLLAEVAAESLQERADAKGMTIDADVSCGEALVRGDQTMLSQAVFNLAENAVHYGKPGGHIGIEVEAAGAQCRLRVRDDGPGIAPEDQARIFDRFYQGNAARSGSGFGLGLSLVKRIAELHGGTVMLASVPGQGCCFEIVLKREVSDEGNP